MIIWMPSDDLNSNIHVLRFEEVSVQRQDALSLLNAVMGRASKVVTHMFVVEQWRTKPQLLMRYAVATCCEYVFRTGNKHDDFMTKILSLHGEAVAGMTDTKDPWELDAEMQNSHRQVLLDKAPFYYGPRFGTAPFRPMWHPEDRNPLHLYWPLEETRKRLEAERIAAEKLLYGKSETTLLNEWTKPAMIT